MNNETILFDNKWIQVKQKGHFVFIHHPWCKGMGVAILPFRYKRGQGQVEYLAVLENCPAHSDEPKVGAITGGYDKEGETFAECAIRELEEEGGYVVPSNEIISLGTVRPTKVSDSTMHLFAVEINDHHPSVEITGDGTVGEEGIEPIWLSKADAVLGQDPLIATMVARLDLLKEKE